MTITYDPTDSIYTDEADVRGELARTQEVCNGCRRCVDLCGVFPTLFEMLDAMAEPSADLLTPAQQDVVVDACVHCTLCAVGCPYESDSTGANGGGVDVPRLMLRARAMQFENDHLGVAGKTAVRVLARPDRVGRIATKVPALANRIVGVANGSRSRNVLARVTGASSERRLGTFATRRFSDWFGDRPTIRLQRRHAAVTVFPTCIVEYQATSIGKDLVKVYERNGIECSVSAARCCGAPLLHAGDATAFAEVAEANMVRLAAEIRAGTDIVVPQPGCAHVLTVDSVDYVTSDQARSDARLVAERTFDAADYLMRLHRGGHDVLDTDFEGVVHRRITYQASAHTRARRDGFPGRDLMRLTGALIDVVHEPTGIGGIWSMRSGVDGGDAMTPRLTERLPVGDGDVIVSDSYLAGLAIGVGDGEEAVARHPLQVIARAYGIPEET